MSHQSRNAQKPGIARAGVAMPADVWSGRRFFREDHGIDYYYDGANSKWQSIAIATLAFGRSGTTATGNYLRYADALGTSARGFVFPRNGTVVGMAGSWSTSLSGSSALRVRLDGSTVTGALLSGVLRTYVAVSENFATDNVLSLFLENLSASVTEASFLIEVRWRP